MKYIKLFENFNNEEDILYDIEHILTGLNPPSSGSSKPELLRNELNGNLLFYKVDNNYTPEDYKTAIKRLVDLDYEILTDTSHGIVNANNLDEDSQFTLIKSDYFKDKTIEGVCLQWLKEKFGNLKEEDDNRAINYVDDNGNKIIRFYKQRDKGDNYLINQDLVWSLFNKIFRLSYNNTQEIISIWLKETYNLTKMQPFSWIPPPNRN